MANGHRPLLSPNVSINGTSQQALIAQIQAITGPLREAFNAIGQGMPHARDYPDAEESYKARDAFLDRRTAINQMINEFDALALSIYEQGRR